MSSQWNRCAGIVEDDYSVQARYKLLTALSNLKDLNLYESAFTAEVLFLLATLVKVSGAIEYASRDLKT